MLLAALNPPTPAVVTGDREVEAGAPRFGAPEAAACAVASAVDFIGLLLVAAAEVKPWPCGVFADEVCGDIPEGKPKAIPCELLSN